MTVLKIEPGTLLALRRSSAGDRAIVIVTDVYTVSGELHGVRRKYITGTVLNQQGSMTTRYECYMSWIILDAEGGIIDVIDDGVHSGQIDVILN